MDSMQVPPPDDVVGNHQRLGVPHSADDVQRPNPFRMHHMLLHLHRSTQSRGAWQTTRLAVRDMSSQSARSHVVECATDLHQGEQQVRVRLLAADPLPLTCSKHRGSHLGSVTTHEQHQPCLRVELRLEYYLV